MSEQTANPSLAVLFFVDLHWSGKKEQVLPNFDGIDLVVLGGDLTNFGGVEPARIIVERIQATGIPLLAVCGNCDLPEVEAYMDEAGIGLDRRAREVSGVRFVGLSAGLPFGNCPYERTESEYEEACREAWSAADEVADSAGPTVFVTHQPPRDTVCDLARGRHVGSTAIRDCILEHQPDLVLCGHIHEAIGQDTIGQSRIVNPGPWYAGHSLRFRVEGSQIELEQQI